jgi:pimeloyl-ACP methyl ester carboxylesterase
MRRSLIALLLWTCSLVSVWAQQSATTTMVDAGGYKLYASCMGAGAPTVILESGLGDSSRVWMKVAPDIAKFARVCSYDRANIARSQPQPRALRDFEGSTYVALRSSRDLLHDLQRVLEDVAPNGPYVFVGHSFGGMSVALYAAAHPGQVAGIVLVDSVHPDQVRRLEALMSPMDASRDHDGLMQNREGFDVDRVLAAVRSLNWHTNVPLIVVAEGKVDPNATEADKREAQLWRQLQSELVQFSSRGSLIIAEESGHDIQNEQPDVVVQAIRRVIESANSSR